MGKREAFKRIISLFLSLAMAVTLLPAQMAYAQNDSMPGSEARVSSPGDAAPELDESLKNPLCYYGFENESELTGKKVGTAEGAVLKTIMLRNA